MFYSTTLSINREDEGKSQFTLKSIQDTKLVDRLK